MVKYSIGKNNFFKRVTFGKYTNLIWLILLADEDYCKWMIKNRVQNYTQLKRISPEFSFIKPKDVILSDLEMRLLR